MAVRAIAMTYGLLASAACWSTPAGVQQVPVGIDGCAVLASIVYREVTEARLGYSAGPSEFFSAGRTETLQCTRTVHSATSAYTAALRMTGIRVTWGLHAGYGGGHCLSHLLAQCVPVEDRALPPLSREQRRFVRLSWQSVQGAITTRMSVYSTSDVSRFQCGELARSIRHSIGANRSGHRSYIDAHGSVLPGVIRH
jgi:hypothetical protein